MPVGGSHTGGEGDWLRGGRRQEMEPERTRREDPWRVNREG